MHAVDVSPSFRLSRSLRSIALILALACPVAHAQPAAIRISPPDTPLYPLAADTPGGSAARLGSTTLVVWGTTRQTTPPERSNDLVTRIIRDGAPAGTTRSLVGPDARPSGTVALLALRDRFMALWNDIRSGSLALYRRDIDTMGEPIGPEMLLGDGAAIVDDEHLYLLRDGEGYRVIWLDTRPGLGRIFDVRLDVEYNVLGEPLITPRTDFDRDRHYDELPGATIHLDRSSAMFIHADGRTDPRPIPFPHVANPHVIGADTSVAVIEDRAEGPTAAFYRSIFDTADTGHVLLRARRGSVLLQAIGRDTAGGYWVISSSDEVHGDPTGGDANLWALRYPMSLDGNVGSPDTIGTFGSIGEHKSASFDQKTQIIDQSYTGGDRNSSRLEVDTRSSLYIHYGATTIDTMRTVLAIDRNGYPFSLDPALRASAAADIRTRVAVTRAQDDDSSVVLVDVDSPSVRLAAAIAPMPRNLAQSGPQLIERDGRVYVAWRQQSTVDAFAMRSFPPAEDSVMTAAAIVPDPVAPRNDGTDLHRTASRLAPEIGVVYLGTDLHHYPSNQWSGTGYLRIHVPGDTGWSERARSSWGASEFSPASAPPKLQGLAVDRETGLMMGAIDIPETNWMRVFGANGAGVIWMADRPRVQMAGMIPARGGEFLLMEQSGARRYRDSTLLETLVFGGEPYGAARYRRLASERFLRMMPGDGIDSLGMLTRPRITLQLYTLAGTPLAINSIDVPSSRYDAAVADRASDSAIVLAWGVERSLHLVALDRGLNRRLDTVIGPMPGEARSVTSLFHGDTLLLAWEDARDGEPDIYGMRVMLPPIVAATHPPPDHTMKPAAFLRRIMPLPADRSASIEIGFPDAGRTTLELYDAAGRSVLKDEREHEEDDMMWWQIDTAPLRPGAYEVVVRAGGSVLRGRLVVVH